MRFVCDCRSIVSNLCFSVHQHSIPFPPHQKPKDSHLALFVCALVAVDVVILLLFTLVEGLQGNLEPSMVPNTENPSDTIGVSMIHAGPRSGTEQATWVKCLPTLLHAFSYMGYILTPSVLCCRACWPTLLHALTYSSAVLLELSPMVYILFLLVLTDHAGRVSILHIRLQLHCP